MKKAHQILLISCLSVILLAACRKNYSCLCTNEQTVFNSFFPNGNTNNFTMNNSVRAYEEKKAEQACFSTYAKEPQTMASPNQTVISATTCTLQ